MSNEWQAAIDFVTRTLKPTEKISANSFNSASALAENIPSGIEITTKTPDSEIASASLRAAHEAMAMPVTEFSNDVPEKFDGFIEVFETIINPLEHIERLVRFIDSLAHLKVEYQPGQNRDTSVSSIHQELLGNSMVLLGYLCKAFEDKGLDNINRTATLAVLLEPYANGSDFEKPVPEQPINHLPKTRVKTGKNKHKNKKWQAQYKNLWARYDKRHGIRRNSNKPLITNMIQRKFPGYGYN